MDNTRFDEGHIDYNNSVMMCNLCKNGNFKTTGVPKGSNEKKDVCTAITLPHPDHIVQTPGELEQIARKLCPDAGKFAEFAKLDKGYIQGSYFTCQCNGKH